MKIVLKGLTKLFKSRNKDAKEPVVAVKNFDFEIPDGKLIGLLGPSGCGKSTALNLISGLETPTEGKIFFGDEDVTDLQPEFRGVGMVFQNYALYPHLTVRQNITFPLENFKKPNKLTKEQKEERVLNVAKLVEIEDLLERKPSEMSGGQQQRVAIARALAKQPKVLLLDEPLSNLDARLRLQTREEIRRIQRETGLTTVFVTHDQEEAMSISDMIIVMKKGEVQQIGAPQDVYDDPTNLFVATFLGTPPINVFDGRIDGGALYIGSDKISDVDCGVQGKVTVGIRPEGLTISDEGVLNCALKSVEVMGRDTSVVALNENLTSQALRAIVSSENARLAKPDLTFKVNADKLFLFDAESGLRIPFSAKDACKG
ncbi:MAG: ABC transporter ATP-binding protein [Clostridia bacterium]|nr:ABC transporter ATP-binding protein [Clostridia bacterium]